MRKMASPGERQVEIKPVQSAGELLQALAIREVVFIEEQHIPESFERDADDDRAYHVLALEGGHAIGTGRMVMLSKPPKDETGRWVQISRMAVLGAYRHTGVGTRLLETLEAQAKRSEAAGIILHAQLSSLEFYQGRGYQPVGAAFQEGGMPHLEMRKAIP